MKLSFLAVALPFSLIAAAMAYLIIYNEWIHHYPSKKEPRKIALEAAIFTFIVFSLLTLAAGYVLTRYIISRG